MRTAFGKELDKILKQKSMRFIELGKLMNCSPTYVSNLINGYKVISDDIINDIVKILNLTEKQKNVLLNSALESCKSATINLMAKTFLQRKIVITFKTAIENNTLSTDQIQQILKILTGENK